jgi:hypothetical protein
MEGSELVMPTALDNGQRSLRKEPAALVRRPLDSLKH